VADAGVDGQLQLDEGLVVAVQRDPLGREAGGQGEGQLVAEQASRCRPSSAIQRATCPQRNALEA
jgi:hypothetical protein